MLGLDELDDAPIVDVPTYAPPPPPSCVFGSTSTTHAGTIPLDCLVLIFEHLKGQEFFNFSAASRATFRASRVNPRFSRLFGYNLCRSGIERVSATGEPAHIHALLNMIGGPDTMRHHLESSRGPHPQVLLHFLRALSRVVWSQSPNADESFRFLLSLPSFNIFDDNVTKASQFRKCSKHRHVFLAALAVGSVGMVEALLDLVLAPSVTPPTTVTSVGSAIEALDQVRHFSIHVSLIRDHLRCLVKALPPATPPTNTVTFPNALSVAVIAENLPVVRYLLERLRIDCKSDTPDEFSTRIYRLLTATIGMEPACGFATRSKNAELFEILAPYLCALRVDGCRIQSRFIPNAQIAACCDPLMLACSDPDPTRALMLLDAAGLTRAPSVPSSDVDWTYFPIQPCVYYNSLCVSPLYAAIISQQGDDMRLVTRLLALRHTVNVVRLGTPWPPTPTPGAPTIIPPRALHVAVAAGNHRLTRLFRNRLDGDENLRFACSRLVHLTSAHVPLGANRVFLSCYHHLTETERPCDTLRRHIETKEYPSRQSAVVVEELARLCETPDLPPEKKSECALN
eukprot:gnl/Spiro4/5722_TR2926_c0_g1_i1.p1 gnl/Spiro4/5722_TR2926_c0_g1~~gnl/Spiro4/5722_TR2926_c0_g1_i1.p1  ORF type:complete len:569 (-),score=63.95 gnl/Spiro4/5722_TR2926_c0_g1_i1:205-1911(-)